MNIAINNTNLYFQDEDASLTQFLSEEVGWIILDRPYVTTDSGATMAFPVTLQFNYNYTFWPWQSDTFLRKLFTDDLEAGHEEIKDEKMHGS